MVGADVIAESFEVVLHFPNYHIFLRLFRDDGCNVDEVNKQTYFV